MPTTQITDLPVAVIDADVAQSLPVEPDPTEGQLVIIFSRGRYRLARVTKVGPKRVTAEYTTPGAINTAYEIASTNREALAYRSIASLERIIARYTRMAELIDTLGIEITDNRPVGEKFVPLASLPAEYAKLDAESGTNGSRSTIVRSSADLRKWADNARQSIESEQAKLDSAKAYDALPLNERAAKHVHMTTKTVGREQVMVWRND